MTATIGESKRELVEAAVSRYLDNEGKDTAYIRSRDLGDYAGDLDPREIGKGLKILADREDAPISVEAWAASNQRSTTRWRIDRKS